MASSTMNLRIDRGLRPPIFFTATLHLYRTPLICKQEHFPEGTLSHIVCVDEKGRKQGSYVGFYTTGDTAFVIDYTNDSIDGYVWSCYKNGSKRYLARYSMNRIMEMIEFYDLNGNRLETGNMYNGNGTLRVYDQKGSIALEGMIVNGFMEGPWKVYGRTEEIFYVKEFVSGVDRSTNRRRLIF